jgi:hypothetical protein
MTNGSTTITELRRIGSPDPTVPRQMDSAYRPIRGRELADSCNHLLG